MADLALQPEKLSPPSPLLLLGEGRAFAEAAMCAAALPLLMGGAPLGDRHPVLVMPGFMADDYSTLVLRSYLSVLGYRVYGWRLGSNRADVMETRRRLRDRLREVRDLTGDKVSLIGWSLGGVYARDLALSTPDAVRYVITLGSPFAGDRSASNVRWLFKLMTGSSGDQVPPEHMARVAGPMPVPTTAVHSRSDGIVHWRTCLTPVAPQAENVEVLGSHNGLGFNPAVLWLVADRLAQLEGNFTPFDRRGPFMLAYGSGPA